MNENENMDASNFSGGDSEMYMNDNEFNKYENEKSSNKYNNYRMNNTDFNSKSACFVGQPVYTV